MKFHAPSSPWYDRTNAEVWFRTAEAAEAAGFVNAEARGRTRRPTGEPGLSPLRAGPARGAARTTTLTRPREEEDMAVSAADVKKLRELTGAGMMDCKKALEEAEGDFDKAAELTPRSRGRQWPPARRRARGLGRAGRPSGGALVELNCETDFVAKGDDFVATAQRIADAAVRGQGRRRRGAHAVGAARRQDRRRGRREPRHHHRREDRARRVAHFEGTSSPTCTSARPTCRPPWASSWSSTATSRAPAARRCRSRRCARSSSPATRSPPTRSRTSAQIAEATSREEGKPEQAIAKITEGRLNGFFKEVVLLEQPSVTENKKSVKAVLDESGTNVTASRASRSAPEPVRFERTSGRPVVPGDAMSNLLDEFNIATA